MQCRGAAPWLAPGALAARQTKRSQTGHSTPVAGCAEQRLTAPECLVLTQADAVPGEHQPLAIAIQFGRNGTRVRRVVPDALHRQCPLLLCPAMGRIARVRVADDTFGAHAIQRLQVGRNLLKYREASRTVHLADVRRNNDASTPAERHRTFHVSAGGQGRLTLSPRQLNLQWRTATANAQRPHPAIDATEYGVIRRSHDRPVVLQETVGNLAETHEPPQRCR